MRADLPLVTDLGGYIRAGYIRGGYTLAVTVCYEEAGHSVMLEFSHTSDRLAIFL